MTLSELGKFSIFIFVENIRRLNVLHRKSQKFEKLSNEDKLINSIGSSMSMTKRGKRITSRSPNQYLSAG